LTFVEFHDSSNCMASCIGPDV